MGEKQGLMPTDEAVLLDLDEMSKAISMSRAEQTRVLPLVRKSYSADTMTSGTEDGEPIKFKRRQSFGAKVASPRADVTKMRSKSDQFPIDIDRIVHGGRGSLIEIEGVVSRASPFSLHQDDAVTETSISQKTNLDVDIWNKLQIEPTLPVCLKFSDVRYEVKVKGRRSPNAMKYILHGVTGSVGPGEVLALMGPSGGGKTTLLNLLSGRMKTKGHGGRITYNDQPYSKWLKRRIGFVLQDDVVFPHLTVRETLTYAALLRLPKKLTKQQKEERAMSVIFELGLERCQDTIIGGAFVRGISGGERKRVCIGNEILLNPSLLFLDEPTTGLDSTTALRIGQMLHNIANAGKTVVTTIHQPSSRLFNKFDKLILLGNGSSLYFGKASEAMLYFSSIGCSPLIAMNPAEFLIDLANGNINDKSIPSELEYEVLNGSHEIKRQEGKLSPMYIHEYLLGAYETRVAHIEKKKLLKPVSIDSKWEVKGGLMSREVGASWCEQYYILFRRGLKERHHDYLSYVRVIQVLSTAIIIGLLWWHSNASSQKKLQDQAGLLFFISVFWSFFPVFTSIFTFPQERAMLAKERSVGMYKLSAYFIARNTSDLPLELILPTFFLLIVYFMVGLEPVFTVFLQSMMTVFLCIIAAQGLGLVVGAALMDVKKASTLASVVIMTFMLAGGFFLQRVPLFMSWIRYLSFNYQTYRLLLKVQYGCSKPSHSGFIPCKSPYIEGLQLDDGRMEAATLIAMVFGYRLLAYIILRKMKLQSIN